jgi:thiamine-phosphate pyrophosphorylase
MSKNPVDLRLYALVDPQRAGGFALADLAAKVVQGGATLVQLRDKVGTTRAMIAQARAIKAALAGTGVPLLINDRVDVALASGADGVHVGWDDMEPKDARALLGPKAIIGLSINNAERARSAPVDLLDYAAVGAVYATSSKDNPNPPMGVTGAKALADIVRSRASMPVGAISGIDESNTAAVIAGGFDGVAVISALSITPDPVAAARRLRGLVDSAIKARVPA